MNEVLSSLTVVYQFQKPCYSSWALIECNLNAVLHKTSICETSSGTVTNYKKNLKNVSKNLAKNVPRVLQFATCTSAIMPPAPAPPPKKKENCKTFAFHFS